MPSDTGPGWHVGFTSVAMSGGVLVAGLPGATIGANENQGAVYLFTEPAGGWSNETEQAKLVASDGQAGDLFGSPVAISGDTVVAGGRALYVFTKPSGGWSGTLHEAAKLTVTDPSAGPLSSLAISGATIVAGFTGTCGCYAGQHAYVFTEPAGGWSGTIHESATLTASDASSSCDEGLSAVAIDGPTVGAVALGPDTGCSPATALVFTEPASGWSGSIHDSATLIAPSLTSFGSVAVIGSSVVAGGHGVLPDFSPVDPVVFNAPASEWSGTIRPAASLNVSTTPANDDFTEVVAGSQDEIAALVIPQNDMCPMLSCGASLYAFSRPLGGWAGMINGPNAGVTVPGGDTAGGGGTYPLAIEGRTIASGGLDGIDIFTITPGPPSIRNASLSGLAIGRPRIRFALDADQNAAPIRSFKLSLPRGVRFASHHAGRTRGVRISVPARVATLRPGALTVTLRHPAESLSVAIDPSATIEQNSLIAQIRRIRRYNRTHRRKRALTVSARCLVTDATSHNTLLILTTRIS